MVATGECFLHAKRRQDARRFAKGSGHLLGERATLRCPSSWRWRHPLYTVCYFYSLPLLLLTLGVPQQAVCPFPTKWGAFFPSPPFFSPTKIHQSLNRSVFFQISLSRPSECIYYECMHLQGGNISIVTLCFLPVLWLEQNRYYNVSLTQFDVFFHPTNGYYSYRLYPKWKHSFSPRPIVFIVESIAD